MNIDGLEIERKYLIRFPELSFLSACASKTDIVQTYLLSDAKGRTERVRKRGSDGAWTYTHTVKKRISELRREEAENEVAEKEYLELMQNADPSRKVINKSRYCIPYCGHVFEIDIYPFWPDRAIMEVELADETDSIVFPPKIKIVREVTGDRRYTNASLAKDVPYDDI